MCAQLPVNVWPRAKAPKSFKTRRCPGFSDLTRQTKFSFLCMGTNIDMCYICKPFLALTHCNQNANPEYAVMV